MFNGLQIKSFRQIRKIVGSTIKDRFVGILLESDAFQQSGFLRCHILVTRLENSLFNVRKNALCVCQKNGKRILVWEHEITDEKLFGVVVRVERDLEVQHECQN